MKQNIYFLLVLAGIILILKVANIGFEYALSSIWAKIKGEDNVEKVLDGKLFDSIPKKENYDIQCDEFGYQLKAPRGLKVVANNQNYVSSLIDANEPAENISGGISIVPIAETKDQVVLAMQLLGATILEENGITKIELSGNGTSMNFNFLPSAYGTDLLIMMIRSPGSNLSLENLNQVTQNIRFTEPSLSKTERSNILAQIQQQQSQAAQNSIQDSKIRQLRRDRVYEHGMHELSQMGLYVPR